INLTSDQILDQRRGTPIGNVSERYLGRFGDPLSDEVVQRSLPCRPVGQRSARRSILGQCNKIVNTLYWQIGAYDQYKWRHGNGLETLEIRGLIANRVVEHRCQNQLILRTLEEDRAIGR